MRINLAINHPQRQSGYTLIELAIVTAIVAVLIAGGLSTVQRFNRASKIAETNRKIDVIEEALVNYFNVNRALPCPVSQNQAISGSFTTWSNNGTSCINPNGNGAQDPRGTVPFSALGLQKEYMTDAWGNYFTYYVSPGYVDAYQFSSLEPEGTEIEVWEDRSTAVHVTELTAGASNYGAVYILVSHGPNGAGAYTRAGTRISDTPIAANLNELENVDNDNGFVTRPMTTPTAAAPFDDIVRFGTKAMFGENAMLKKPYYRIRYSQQAYTRANALMTAYPARDISTYSANQQIEDAVFTSAYWLRALWSGTSSTPSGSLWRCVDNLLYMNAQTLAPASYGVSNAAGTYNMAGPDCKCPGNRTQNFNLSTSSNANPFGACR